ncbi:MAG TPA: hypothetical protein VFZ25_04375 [Chloroflexota bacterium]|nr:hypothetical protein [Chloroflexota bacterium]
MRGTVSILRAIALILLATSVLSACGGPAGPLGVDSVTLMRDDGSGHAGDTVTDFKPTDHKLYAEAKLNQSTSGVSAKAIWLAVDTTAGKNITIAQVDLGTLEGATTLNTNLSVPRDLPVGKYQVDFYLNGKVAKSAMFNVNP